jgi:hypothetical protein
MPIFAAAEGLTHNPLPAETLFNQGLLLVLA